MSNQTPRQAHLVFSVTVLLTLLASAIGSYAMGAATDPGDMQGEFQGSDHAVTPNLRDIAPLREKEGRREKPIGMLRGKGTVTATRDAALQRFTTSAPSFGNVISFDGLGVGGGYTPNAAPPDANGAVGETQYVQWVNESFGVYDKNSHTRLYGPAAGNTLFQALGSTHPCAVNNDGDPIAQYDKAAKRWVMTQFSVTNGSTQGYWQCVAVSKTSDATGAYNVYAFDYGTTDFNDYPKLAIWNNAYYITFNIFANGASFSGPKLCAYDRNAMLAGSATANQACFQLSTQYGGVLPADLDGTTPPPSGSPEYFVDFNTNSLDVWKMSNLNFVNKTATLSAAMSVPASPFSAACSGGGTCIPQAGTSQLLDSLADRLMYRLAYRNFGDHESLVVNHSVTAGSSVGIRWYELRDLGNATPTVYQQGTYAPDATYRWMGSAAMDHVGNLAIGYSASSSSINPGIRFAGRNPSDPPGTLSSEITIKDGTGSQLRSLNRWGDYSSISVDPLDDCTLWYTTEYLQANGTFNWSTRIGNFKFSNCTTTPDYSITATPPSQTVTQGAGTSYTVTVTPAGGFTGTVALAVSGLPSGAGASFTPTSIANGSGSSNLAITTSTSTPTGSYPLTITGTSVPLSHSTTVTLVVTGVPVPDYSISASPSSQTVPNTGSTSYNVAVTAINNFSGQVQFTVSGLPGNTTASFNPNPLLGGSGSSTLSVATAGAATGTYTLTITGASGGLTHSTTVKLVVGQPNFAIAATPASITVTRGSNATYTVAITSSGGFSGAVNLSVTGLPKRSLATFSPNPVNGSGNSTLTVTTSRKVSAGTFHLTIQGTSGSLTNSTTVTLITR